MNKKRNTRDTLLDYTFEEVYIHGYTATSVDTILAKAKITKGSLYHHFKSKKDLVLAMVEERLFVEMDSFFSYEKIADKSVKESFRTTLLSIARNKLLVRYGCPLYRLMVELSASDKEFDALLSSKAKEMQEGIKSLLQTGIDIGEFNDSLDTQAFSGFILSTVWGILSLSPVLSSSKTFVEQSKFILIQLEQYTN